MKQDQMFKDMGDSLRSYSPEVPSHVYSGIRKKLAWSQFLTFSASSLNVYYVGIALAAAGWGWMNFQNADAQATQIAEHKSQLTKTDRVSQGEDVKEEVAQFAYANEAVKLETINSGVIEAVNSPKAYKPSMASATPKALKNEIPALLRSRTAALDFKENHPELSIADRLLVHDYDASDLVGQIIAEQEVLSIKIVEHHTTNTTDGQ